MAEEARRSGLSLDEAGEEGAEDWYKEVERNRDDVLEDEADIETKEDVEGEVAGTLRDVCSNASSSSRDTVSLD